LGRDQGLGSTDRGRLGGLSFLRYLRRTSAGGAVEYAAQLLGGLIRPELLRSGATAEEEHRPLPGDDRVPDPVWEATRAVTIDAPPAEVWPGSPRWATLAAVGTAGTLWSGEDTGVSRLLEELPPPRVGDLWLDGPGCDETKGAWNVRAVEPPWTLVLHSMRDPITGRELDPAEKPRLFIDSAWAFHLDQIAPQRSRLLARTRIRMMPRWAVLPLKWMGSGDTVMQRRLLDGIKVRVEAAAGAAQNNLSEG
jgi:hypothetical protein